MPRVGSSRISSRQCRQQVAGEQQLLLVPPGEGGRGREQAGPAQVEVAALAFRRLRFAAGRDHSEAAEVAEMGDGDVGPGAKAGGTGRGPSRSSVT